LKALKGFQLMWPGGYKVDAGRGPLLAEIVKGLILTLAVWLDVATRTGRR